tara:strand:+ start:2607 stop:4025 length:1419 start_codon:yes stop_codon:yes gene_type:complete
MIGSFRNFAKTKFAGLLVFIMIIPFVFWGMGSMFSSGNTNNIAKIDKTNISTQDFIDHINNSKIPQQTIRENLDKNIIEELLSTLISTTLLDLEVKDFNIFISENTLLKKIKTDKNFLNENGDFDRIKYEKFLLENNQSAVSFELGIKGVALQKNLFDYIGAGTSVPKFLVKKLYEEENRNIEVEYINLENFYKKKDEFTETEIMDFLKQNKNELKVEYIDFDYAILNPKNLVGVDDFNQTFFDTIDEIEEKFLNSQDLRSILSDYNIKTIEVKDYRDMSKKNKIEKKIFESRNIDFDIIENDNNYVVYKINKTEERSPNIDDPGLKKEILELITQRNKFDYNRLLFKKINDKKFNDNDFKEMGIDKIETLTLTSINDNQKFETNTVELLYSLPTGSFTLVNDYLNEVYLAKIKSINNENINTNDEKFKEYIKKQNTNTKNNILRSYDFFLNEKYNVVLNQKTIERVKNFFQ